MTEFLQSIQNNKVSRIFFFLFVLLLPTQFGKHFWPPFAFVNGLQVDYLSPTLYLTDIITFIFILSTIKKIKISFLFLLFLVVVSIGIFLSKQPFSGWYSILKLLEYFSLWHALQNYLSQTKNPFERIVIPLSVGILFESILSFFQFLMQKSVGGLLYFLGERTFSASTPGIANASIAGQLIMRPYGTFPHPNVLAGFLIIGLIILLMQFFLEKKILLKIVVFITIIIGTLALLTTLSRVAISVWIILGLYLLIKNVPFKKNIRILLAFIFLIIITVAILLSLSPVGQRLKNISLADESISQRIFLLSQAWSMFITSPLFGVGFANFLINLKLVSFKESFVYIVQPVHNIFMLLLAETGITGFFLSVVFLYKSIKQLLLSNKKLYNEEIISTMLVLVLAWGVLGMFDHFFLTLQQGQMLTVLLFSLCWSFQKKSSTI